MCWSLMVLGLLVMTILICVLFILLLLLCRWSACILRCVEPCLADSMKIAARAAKAECNDEEDFNTANVDDFLQKHDYGFQVPAWSEAVVNFYAELPTCWCLCWCHFKGNCVDGCLTFVFLELPYLVLLELPLWFLTIALPSFVKFYLDIFFVLTIFKSLIIAFPSFSFVFPYFNLSFPNIDFDFGFFAFSMPTWVEAFFSFCATLAFPSWEGKCGSTRDMGTVFYLAAALVTASVIVTSDLLAFLLDCQSRIQILKQIHQCRLARLREGLRETKQEKAEERGIKGLWRFGFLKIEVLCLKGRLLIIKAFIELASRSSDLGLYVILWVTGLVMNHATLSLVLLIPRFVQLKDEPYDSDHWSCTLGMWFAIRFLHLGIMLWTAFYFLKVLSGRVHKDSICSLSAAMVRQKKIDISKFRRRLAAFIRLTLCQFFLPFVAAGLKQRDWQNINKAFLYDLPLGQKWTPAAFLEVMKNKWSFAPASENKGHVFSALNGFLSGKVAVLGAVVDMDEKFPSSGRQVRLRQTAAFDFRRHVVRHADDSSDSKFKSCWKILQSAILCPFGIMTNNQADATAVHSRCSLWHAQVEAVYKATCYSVGQTLLLVPFFGALWYTAIKWLSEAPAGLWLKDHSAAESSFFLERRDVKPFVTPSWWCMLAFLVVLARLGVAYFAIWGPDFSFLVEIGPVSCSIARMESCALVSTGLCSFQNWLMKQNDTSNSKRIAKKIVERVEKEEAEL